jgi:hypothetical protein
MKTTYVTKYFKNVEEWFQYVPVFGAEVFCGAKARGIDWRIKCVGLVHAVA